MVQKSFNNESGTQVQIVAHDLEIDWQFRKELEILQNWGFKLRAAGVQCFGESNTERAYATLDLPEGWRKFGGFDPDESMSYMDEKGSLRVSVHNSPAKGRMREIYSVSFYNRFSTGASQDRKGNVDFSKSVIRDNKTGAEFPVDIGFDDETSLSLDNIWEDVLLEKFGDRLPFVPETYDEANLAMASLWDQDITLTQIEAEDMAVRALDKLYEKQLAELEQKRAKLPPPQP